MTMIDGQPDTGHGWRPQRSNTEALTEKTRRGLGRHGERLDKEKEDERPTKGRPTERLD